MTKKHFEAIARILANARRCEHIGELRKGEAHAYIVSSLATLFKVDNRRFDMARFMRASGLADD